MLIMAPPHGNVTTASTAINTACGGPMCGQKEERKSTLNHENTLFVIDWDDTLLASSWLASMGLKLDSPEIPEDVKSQLEVLEEHIINFLGLIGKLGAVAIVTNAEHGWVELSARKFVPKVVPYLNNIRILSARTEYEDLYPKDVARWKVEAYNYLYQEAFCGSVLEQVHQVVSLGDSMYERNALMNLAERASSVLPKSVKFVERPTMVQLQRQIEIVHSNLESVYSSHEKIDLMLTVEYLE